MSSAGHTKAVVIPIARARAALEQLRQRNQHQVDKLQAEIAALRVELQQAKATPEAEHNNAPGKKHGKKYQRQLAKVRAAVEAGELSSLGRASLKRFAECGDKIAESLQVDLVDLGLARRTPSGQVRRAA